MIYKGKEYEWVARHKAKVGDLVRIVDVCWACGVSEAFYEVITGFDSEGDIRFDSGLPNGTGCITSGDEFRVYRYLEDVKEENV